MPVQLLVQSDTPLWDVDKDQLVREGALQHKHGNRREKEGKNLTSDNLNEISEVFAGRLSSLGME